MRTRDAFLILCAVLALFYGRAVFALPSAAPDVQSLQDAVSQKKTDMQAVERRISQLEGTIVNLQKQARTLENQRAVLENRIAKTTLDIERTQLQSSTLLDEIIVIEQNSQRLEDDLVQKRAGLRQVLRERETTDQRGPLFLLFGTRTFSEFFEEVRAMERLNKRLQDAVGRVKEAQQTLLVQKDQKEEKLGQVQELAQQLSLEQERFSREQAAKTDLLVITRNSEQTYQSLVRDLEAEQSAIERDILSLQENINARLRQEDVGENLSAFSWPMEGYARLTTLFRDPTYPFRALFEHSGIDIPAPVGTSVHAAAPGYVAFTRIGTQYGNYIMIIHADGFATLYAHLSQFNVSPDQFVTRGQVIGRSGGARGARGSGLSTGPHLHFEIRKNGIPTDPLIHVIRP